MSAPLSPNIRNRFILLFTYFFLFGFGGAAYIVRLPEVRSLLGINTAQMGWVLFAGAVGALFSLLISGKFIARFGSRIATVLGFTFLSLGQVITGLGAVNGSVALVTVGSLISGIAYGIGDVGINVEGAAQEKEAKRSLLPQLHGAFSLGTLSGAVVGTIFLSTDISLLWQQVGVAIISLIVVLVSFRGIPSATGRTTRHIETNSKPRLRIEKRLLFLGIGILGLTLAEGGANDWLAMSVVDDVNESETIAGITFAIAMLGMVILRLTGGKIVDRFGRVLALRLTTLLGVAGILLVIIAPNIVILWLGAALWGVGVALGFPLFISAAADGEDSAPNVSVVATFGYAAFLIGPPALGFLGEAWGLTNMFFVLAAQLVVSAIFAFAAKPVPDVPHNSNNQIQ